MSFYRWNPYTSQHGDGVQHRVVVSPPSAPGSSQSSGRSPSTSSPVRAHPPLDTCDAESDSSSSGNTATTARSTGSSMCSVEHARTLNSSLLAEPTRTQSGDVEAVRPSPEGGKLGHPKGESNAAGLALVLHLRTLPSDSAIEEAVRSADDEQKQQLLAVLQADPDVVSELCLSYRGNVLCHTLALLPARGLATARILASLTPLLPEMLQHQHGTIALIRLFDLADTGFVRTLCAHTIGCFSTLAVHPFGNFVVSRVLEALAGDVGAETPNLLSTAEGYLEEATVLNALATSKFGSHVLETWIRVCRAEALLRTAGAIVTNPPLVVALGFHPVGNFPLQAVLRQLARAFPQGHRYAAEVAAVPALVAESRFQLNIRKAVYGTDPRQRDPHRPHRTSRH